MRKKDVIKCFKDVFSEFLLNKEYIFYQNCFVKYKNGVLNRVSLFTQKTIDIVTFDIIHECKPIYEDFVSIKANNERENFSIATLAFTDSIIDDIEWSYLYNNNEDMTAKIQSAFEIYKNYFDFVHSDSIDDYKIHYREYNEKLKKPLETDPYELIADIFSGEYSLDSFPEDKLAEFKEVLVKSRWQSYYLMQYLNEMVNGKCEIDIDAELKYISCCLNEFNKDIEYLFALYNGDEKYLRKVNEREESARQEIIKKNRELLLNAGFNV